LKTFPITQNMNVLVMFFANNSLRLNANKVTIEAYHEVVLDDFKVSIRDIRIKNFAALVMTLLALTILPTLMINYLLLKKTVLCTVTSKV